MAVTKNMLMGEILDNEKAETIAEILMAEGMHCIGCDIHDISTDVPALEEACMAHGIDCDAVLAKINAAIA